MSNYFIIHGSLGNPYENWFPWLQEQLVQDKKEVIVPNFPINEYQNYDNWSKILKQYLQMGLINEDTIFIAHSLGPIFICKFLIEHQIKIKGLISVSGFNTLLGIELDEVNKSFIIENQKLEMIEQYTKFVYCLYSDNDPYVPMQELEDFALHTKAEKSIITGAGHFNTTSGYIRFPEILSVIREAEELSFFESNDMPIGINCIILDKEGRILLAKRKNRFGAGSYGLIGGKVKKWETLEQAAIRELKEEIGILVEKEDIEIINMNVTMDAKHIVQIGALVKKYRGIPENKETNKCEEIAFFDLENLPELFEGSKGNIELLKHHQFYNSQYNTKREKEKDAEVSK